MFFISCKKQDINKPPYFIFDNTAGQWFTNLKVNDSLKFKSNLGHVRIYTVSAIEALKLQVTSCTFTTGNCIIYYEYDEKIIYFNRADSFSSPTVIKISMNIPDSLDFKNLPKNVKAKAKIYGKFDDYNGEYLTFPDIYQNISFASFNGASKNYNEVIKFLSNNTASFYDTGWNRNYNLNQVWYDRKFGFVYFKDIYGEEWIRQN